MIASLYTYLSGRLHGHDVVSQEEHVILERRRIIDTRFLGVYLHHIKAADDDADVYHDHPWSWSFSIILSGHYVEEVPAYQGQKSGSYKKGFLGINFIPKDCFHRIAEISRGGVITLYVRGRRVKEDGFIHLQEDGSWKYTQASEEIYEYTREV